MNEVAIDFQNQHLVPRPSGALFWPARAMLIVSDLHLGKSERIARRGGSMLPPYETTETLARLDADLDATLPSIVICLGDSFDDRRAAQALDVTHRTTLTRMQAGRRWVWIEGNHDPGPIEMGGTHLAVLHDAPLTFRHIARPDATPGEISGHYHPKARLRSTSRPCFMVDDTRLILPAYGHYTGGLHWTAPPLRSLFQEQATAYLTGRQVLVVPVPRQA